MAQAGYNWSMMTMSTDPEHVGSTANAAAQEDEAVLTAPDYMALRARAATLEAEVDPVPELGRQGSSGSAGDEAVEGTWSTGTNSYALRLLQARPSSAPDLSRYPAAVEHGPDGLVFMPPVGHVVVFNMHASAQILPSRPYLKTVKGRITEVDQATGLVNVYDVDRKQQCCLRFTTHDPMQVRWPGRKIWEAQQELMGRALDLLESVDPDDSAEALRLLQQAKGLEGRIETAGTRVEAKRRVGRPRRQRSAEELERERLHAERRAQGKVRRGRPKGSKNRPSEVVEAEKRERREERQAKKKNKQASRK